MAPLSQNVMVENMEYRKPILILCLLSLICQSEDLPKKLTSHEGDFMLSSSFMLKIQKFDSIKVTLYTLKKEHEQNN